jgi:hypothetical protein
MVQVGFVGRIVSLVPTLAEGGTPKACSAIGGVSALLGLLLSGCTLLADDFAPALWSDGEPPLLERPETSLSPAPPQVPAVDDGAPEHADIAPSSPVERHDSTSVEPATPSSSMPPAPTQTPPVSTARSAFTLGYNMDYPGDWTNSPPFIDQMKNARAMQGVCSSLDPSCDLAAHLDLDANGWVRSLQYREDPSMAYARIAIVLNTSDDRHDIGETFVVTWEGRGDIDVYNGADISREPDAQRLTFRLQNDLTMLLLEDIEAGDHVRNVRVFRADHEELLARGEVFDPDLLAFLAPFGSLRFMDWMQSNSRGQCSGGSAHGQECYAETEERCGTGVCLMPGRWDQRPTPHQPSQQAWGQYLDNANPALGTRVGGYPVETLVALANRAGADPHFNMPAHYDDDYVRAFAEQVRDNLAPGLTASVEYSNEVWNWGFPQAQYANVLGRSLWPDDGTAWMQYAAGRTSNMCRIWKEVFEGQSERVRCLISPQTGWRELAETVLDCPAWLASHPGETSCHEYVDAINITGHFSGCLHEHSEVIQSWLAEGRSVAMDRAFEQLEHGGWIEGCEESLDDAIATYEDFKRLADSRGLDLYVYESGTHFPYYEDESVRRFLVDVTADERMYSLYQRNFWSFEAAGGSVFNVGGGVAPNETWSNASSLVSLGHPKYRAIAEFAGGGPPY